MVDIYLQMHGRKQVLNCAVGRSRLEPLPNNIYANQQSWKDQREKLKRVCFFITYGTKMLYLQDVLCSVAGIAKSNQSLAVFCMTSQVAQLQSCRKANGLLHYTHLYESYIMTDPYLENEGNTKKTAFNLACTKLCKALIQAKGWLSHYAEGYLFTSLR